MIDDLNELRVWARSAIDRGAIDEAIESLLEAARHTHVAEDEYAPVARMLADTLAKRGDVRGALTVRWCIPRSEEASWRVARKLAEEAPPVDRARTLDALGETSAAAREMEGAGFVAQAAIYRERAGDWSEARALWSRLAQVVATGRDAAGDAYNGALAQFNIGRCAVACKDPRRAREAFVASVRLLEEAADEFETRGLRERAFDCFHVLVEIGRAGGAFEHVLEGYINCIRILREDHLKIFALQFYEDAVAAAKEASELSAAATIAREAADYARSVGRPAISAYHVLDQAASLKAAARMHELRGAPPAIAENSLLAAILANGQLGRFAAVGALYRTLSEMDLETSRKVHYARAARRYDGVRDEEVEASALPAHLRAETHVVPVWHVDLVEWEQRGSAAEACADVLLDDAISSELRRLAMVARLAALRVEGDAGAKLEPARATELRVKLTEELAQLAVYPAFSPLERLYERSDRAVKLAVLVALRSLHFKRAFVTVGAALRDPDPAIVATACKTTEELAFGHGLDPLARIVRESAEESVRASALKAIARIDSPAAAEMLIGVMEHGAPSDRAAATAALKDKPSRAFAEMAGRVRAR